MGTHPLQNFASSFLRLSRWFGKNDIGIGAFFRFFQVEGGLQELE